MDTTLPITIDRLSTLPPEDRARLLRRVGNNPEAVAPVVREIIADVRERGDVALFEHTLRLDRARLERLEVSSEEYEDALRSVSPGVLRALQVAINNIDRFHRTHLQPQPVVETMPGVRVWREWRPIERVGLYVAGGKAAYPSSLLMQAVAARVAGCSMVIACSPPDPTGLLPAEMLAAASLAGVHRFFKIGGAQAVAAMAYGTETVPQAWKLYGAGSVWVTAAKLAVFGDADIDMPAGPSEILIIADETPDPALLSADLLAQAEHGPDSAAVLLTTSASLAEGVASTAARQLAELPHGERAARALGTYGRILLVDTLQEAVDFANEYAPEHLEIATAEPDELLPLISNAGSIFLGVHAPVASGDYATGSNHVLPTGGAARTFSPLSVESFGRWVQVQSVSRDGLLGLRESVVALAEAEGLEGHARSIDVRFER